MARRPIVTLMITILCAGILFFGTIGKAAAQSDDVVGESPDRCSCTQHPSRSRWIRPNIR